LSALFLISKNLEGNPMKPSKLYEALHALIGERVPLHIWGACGVGKSQIVKGGAKVDHWGGAKGYQQRER